MTGRWFILSVLPQIVIEHLLCFRVSADYITGSSWLHQIRRTHCVPLDVYHLSPPPHTIESQRMTYLFQPHAILSHPIPYLSNSVRLSKPFPLSICSHESPLTAISGPAYPTQFSPETVDWFSASLLQTHTKANCLRCKYQDNSNTVTLERQAIKTGYSGQLHAFLTWRAPFQSSFFHLLYFSAQITHLSNGDINSTYFTEDFHELIHVKYLY